MKVRDIVDLLLLAMLWGIAFLFIRVAVPEFGAVPLIEVRMVLAAAILLPLAAARGQLGAILANWRPIAAMGVLHYAIPFSLFAWSMLTLSGGYASVINASSPLFAGVVARFWLGERLSASRVTGLLVGLAGVVLLVRDKLSVGDGPATLAIAAAVAGSFCYGLAAVLAKKRLAGIAPMAVAGGSISIAALVLLPLTFLLWPATLPSLPAFGMASFLGVASTAMAFVIYFRLIASVGPGKAITVTFLVPLVAIAVGALALAEPVTLPMLGGGLVIVFGTALSTGLIELRTLRYVARTAVARGLLLAIALTVSDRVPGNDQFVPATAGVAPQAGSPTGLYR